MSVNQTRVESGLRNYRIEFAREESLGQVPTDPTFYEYSPTPQEFNWTPEAEPQGRRAIGSEDVQSWEQGPEIHDFSIVYDLVRWFDDGSGNPNDAAYDAMFRGPDGLLSTHTIVAREEKGLLQAENTVNGSEQRETRIYSVGRGCVPAELEIQGDPSDAFPVQISLSYRAQRGRSYQIDQPESGEQLQVVSSSADDTTQDVTVEDEGGTNANTVTLDGTTPVTVGASGDYTDVDAVELSAETVGDVTLQTAGGGNPVDLAVIRGTNQYGDLEGDLGVPTIDGGSHDAAPTSAPETFIGAEIARGAEGDTITHEIPSAVLMVTNELEELERATARAMGVYAGSRTVEFDCTLYGENTTHDLFDEYLRTVQNDVHWHLPSGRLVVEDAVYFEPGERAVETSQAVMEVDATFQGQGLSVITN